MRRGGLGGEKEERIVGTREHDDGLERGRGRRVHVVVHGEVGGRGRSGGEEEEDGGGRHDDWRASSYSGGVAVSMNERVRSVRGWVYIGALGARCCGY